MNELEVVKEKRVSYKVIIVGWEIELIQLKMQKKQKELETEALELAFCLVKEFEIVNVDNS